MTVKQGATANGISERTIYYAKRLDAVRPDLGDRVFGGELSMRAACIEAGIIRERTTWDKLLATWNAATDQDRARLMRMATRDAPVPEHIPAHSPRRK